MGKFFGYSDSQLVGMAQAGNESAMGELFGRMKPVMRRRIPGMYGAGVYDADDLWQDAYFVFRSYVNRLPPGVPLHAYLCGRVGLAVYSYVGRSGMLDKRCVSYESMLDDEDEVGDWMGTTPVGGFQYVVAGEFLGIMTERERLLVLLRAFGFTRREIAGVLDCTVRRVDCRLADLRAKLRRRGY